MRSAVVFVCLGLGVVSAWGCAGDVSTPDGRDGTGGPGTGDPGAMRPGPGTGGTGTTDPNVCAEVQLEASPVTPNVILIVDQSGSMDADFGGGGRRWDVVRDVLIAEPAGLVPRLQGRVRFGLALYSAGGDGAMCPAVETVLPPVLDNLGAIASMYAPAEPLGGTPTGQSIDAVLAMLSSIPDPPPGPTFFVLATDGRPDTCEDGSSGPHGDAASVAAVTRAYERDIKTFVISVGEGSVPLAHLQDVANAGMGVPDGGADAPYYEAANADMLREALEAITGGILSCTIRLDGRIDPATACNGTVRVNGTPVPCDDPNGWRPVDESHIELVGEACDRVSSLAGVTIDASFPCDVILI